MSSPVYLFIYSFQFFTYSICHASVCFSFDLCLATPIQQWLFSALVTILQLLPLDLLIIHPSPLTTQLQADCHGTDPLIHRSHSLMDFHSFIWVSPHSRNLISLLSLSLHLVFVIVSLKCCMPLPSLIPRAPCADEGLMFDKQQVLFVHSCLPLHADVGFPGHRLIWQRCGLSGRFPDQTSVFKWGSRAHLDLSKGIS